MINKFSKTDELSSKWLPKHGKNKHWAYKHVDELTPKEKKQADQHWLVFLGEFNKNNIK